MTLRIEKVPRQGATVFVLAGRILADHLPELKLALEAERDMGRVVLDLKEIRLVEREGVKFLAACEAQGAQLENCPAYVREWMQKEDK